MPRTAQVSERPVTLHRNIEKVIAELLKSTVWPLRRKAPDVLAGVAICNISPPVSYHDLECDFIKKMKFHDYKRISDFLKKSYFMLTRERLYDILNNVGSVQTRIH